MSEIKNRKGYVWFGLFALTALYLTLFSATVLLLRPFWFDINKFLVWALGIEFNWIVIILLLTVGLIAYSASLAAGTLRNIRQDIPPEIRMINRIIPPVILVLWIGMTVLLFSELGNESAMIIIQMKESAPAVTAVILLLALILILPVFGFWKKLRIRAAAFIAVAGLLYVLTIYSGPVRITGGPYLQAPTETSMTIMWTTSQESVSWVEYGEDLNLKAYGTERGLIDANQKIHRVTISGLEPGESVPYRVVSRKIRNFFPYNVEYGNTVTSDSYSFTTLDTSSETASFLVINDLHEHYDLWPGILADIDENPVDFIIFNGDYFNDLNHESQLMNSLIKPVSEHFASEIPFILIRGNHETRGILARELLNYVTLPGEEYYFTFGHGPVRFMALDSGEDKEDGHIEYSGLAAFEEYRKEETAWLERELTTEEWREAPWRIVFSHIPLHEYLSNESPHLSYQPEWNRLLGSAGTDLLLSGHTHKMEIAEATEEIPFPIIIGGGRYEETDGFVVVRVDADRDSMQVSLTDHKGNSIDTYPLP